MLQAHGQTGLCRANLCKAEGVDAAASFPPRNLHPLQEANSLATLTAQGNCWSFSQTGVVSWTGHSRGICE